MDGSPGGTVANGANVLFDTLLSNQTLDITYTPATGEFTFSTTGIYSVSWWIAEDTAATATSVSFNVTTDAVAGPSAFSPLTTGQISGFAIVTIGTVPATMSLVNQSGDTVTFSTTGVQGGIDIVEVKL